MATTVIAEKEGTGIRRYIPILAWLPKYQSEWLRPDIIAGLTIMALLVPEGMAYAQLAGLPPQAVFYAARITWTPGGMSSIGMKSRRTMTWSATERNWTN